VFPFGTDLLGPGSAQVLWIEVTSTLPRLDNKFLNLLWVKNEGKFMFQRTATALGLFVHVLSFNIKKIFEFAAGQK
jgi:hypothetical protein